MADDLEEDMDDGEGPGMDEGAPSRGGSRKLLIILIPVILLVAIAGGLYYFGVFNKIAGLFGGKAPPKAEANAAQVVPKLPGVPLPEMLVNLNSDSRRQNFLKLTVFLQTKNNDTDIVYINNNMALIVDAFQSYLRELRIEDVAGSEGLERLRAELLANVQKKVPQAEVQNVLFQEMLVQ